MISGENTQQIHKRMLNFVELDDDLPSMWEL
jgi:hypothetical protein